MRIFVRSAACLVAALVSMPVIARAADAVDDIEGLDGFGGSESARRTTRFDEVRPDPQAWHGLKRNFEVYASLYDALRHCF